MAIDPTQPKLSLSEIAAQTPVEMNDFSNAGRTVHFDAKGADRFLTYGTKTYGQLGYNPYRDNEAKYQQETPWTKDISRGFNGMMKLAGVGLSDSFAFGAFGSEENHKDFGKIMSDYGSQRKHGSTAFWSNTMLSAGYTVGIIASVAAEEMLLAGATVLSGGLASGVTAPLMAAEAARATSLLGKIGKGAAKLDTKLLQISSLGQSKLGVLGHLRNIENARMYHNTIASFGKALMPLGNTADYLRLFKPAETIGKDMAVAAANFKDLNNLTKTVMGAAALSRDARKIYLSHSESKLEANFVRDEIRDEAIEKWQLGHPGQTMPRDVEEHINAKAQASYDKAYSANFGLIYLTNAITFEGLFKGFSPTNTLLKTIDNYAISSQGFRNVTIEALSPSIKSYIKKKVSSITLPGVIKGTVQASMEGVQEYGQDVISSAAKKYGGVDFDIIGHERDDKGKYIYRDKYDEEGNKIGKEKVPIYGEIEDAAKSMSLGAYWDQVANSLGDSSLETFASGALMGIFASPMNFATKVASEYSFGERGFGSEYNAWTEEGNKKYAELWKQREQSAKIMTQFFRSQGASFEADIHAPSHRMIGLREQMLEAARTGDQKVFEDKKTEIFQLGMRELFKNGMHTELIDHLNQMSGYSAKELNESLDRLDITEQNKSEFLEKIEKRKADITSLKKEYDRINMEMPSRGSVDKVLRDSSLNAEEKQERVLEIIAWDSLKEQMLFAGDKIRNLAERKKGIIDKLKQDTKLTDADIASLTNREDLKTQIKLLEEQIASNKEYKMDNTKEHDKASIKLKALQDLQEGFLKLDDPNFDSDNDTAVADVYSSMEDSFGRYMLAVNSELNDIPNADFYLVNDKNLYSRHIKKFKDLFDFYRLNDEQKELEYYADTLNNPNSSAKWLEARKALLSDIGNNKRAYIERSILSFQERAVSDKILAELMENGIIFDLEQLKDLLSNGVMPSKLYHIGRKGELTAEEYNLALKIIGNGYKNLTGKKIQGFKGKDGSYGARAKFRKDRRRASGLLNAYAGKNKLDVPVPVNEFIDRLLSKDTMYLTTTEIELLRKLKLIPFTNNVILTDSADGPITFNEEGDLLLDVRFGAADYSMPSLPFEYVAISGLVNAAFSEKLKTNPQFAEDISSLMGEVKQAYIARLSNEITDAGELRKQIADVSTSSLFNNALTFLSESFTNKDFQMLLGSIESDVNAKNSSLWLDLSRALRAELRGDFKGTMLDQVLGIAQLNLTESKIEEVVDSPTINETESQETEEEAPAEAEEEVEVTVEEDLPTETIEERAAKKTAITQLVTMLNKDIAGLETEKAKTSSLKFRLINTIKTRIENLKIERDALLKEYSRLEAIDKVVIPTTETPIPQDNVTVDQTAPDGSSPINSSSRFNSLDRELQYALAVEYYRRKLKATPGIDELLDNLTDEEIKVIENLMGQNSFIEIIGKYNSQKTIPITTVEELEDEEEDPDLKLVVFSDAAEKEFEATKERAFAEIITTGTGSTTTFINHLGVEETITAPSEIELRKIISDTYSIEGWANNINNIVGKTFLAQIGDVETEVEILIEKVKLLLDGTIQVQAIRTDTNKQYDMNVNPVNGAIRSHSELGKTSKIGDRNDFIKGFFGTMVEAFDPIGQTTKIKSGIVATPFNLYPTVEELKNDFVGIEDYFTDAELEIIVGELSNINNGKEAAKYLLDVQEALDQRIAQSTRITGTTIGESKQFKDNEDVIRTNWKNLIAGKGYEYTGTDVGLRKKYKSGSPDFLFWKIDQRDLEYIRHSDPSLTIFALPGEQFYNAVLEKLNAIDVYSKSIKNIDASLPKENVEQVVFVTLKEALLKGLAGTKVITALNKKLSAAKSDKVIKYNIRSKTSASTVKITTRSASQKAKKINNRDLLLAEVNDYFMQGEEFVTELQAMYRLFDALKTQKLHPDVLLSLAKKSAGERKAYQSLLSKNSKFKTADGFEDFVLDGLEILGQIGDPKLGNLLIDLLGKGTTLSEIREFFVEEYLKQGSEDINEKIPTLEDYLLNEYLTSEEKAERDASIQTEYESSVEYQILTGQYLGDYNSLTPKQQALYDAVGLQESVSEKKDDIEEDDFFSLLPTISPMEKRVSLFSQKYQGINRDIQIKMMLSDIKGISSLSDLILLHAIINNPLAVYSKEQVDTVNRAILSRVSTYQDLVLDNAIITVDLKSIELKDGIILPAGTFIIQSNTTAATGIGLRVTQLNGNVPYTVDVLDLMAAVENIHEPGEIINTQTIDLSLTNEDNETIKASVTDIFSNFNRNVSEFNNVKDEDLINEIKKEFNNCK